MFPTGENPWFRPYSPPEPSLRQKQKLRSGRRSEPPARSHQSRIGTWTSAVRVRTEGRPEWPSGSKPARFEFLIGPSSAPRIFILVSSCNEVSTRVPSATALFLTPQCQHNGGRAYLSPSLRWGAQVSLDTMVAGRKRPAYKTDTVKFTAFSVGASFRAREPGLINSRGMGPT